MPQVRQYGNCCVMLRCLSFWLGTTWKLQNVVGSKVQYYSITAIVTVSNAVNDALLPQNLLPKMKGTHASKSPRLLGTSHSVAVPALSSCCCPFANGSAVFFGSRNPWTQLKSWRGQAGVSPALRGPARKVINISWGQRLAAEPFCITCVHATCPGVQYCPPYSSWGEVQRIALC